MKYLKKLIILTEFVIISENKFLFLFLKCNSCQRSTCVQTGGTHFPSVAMKNYRELFLKHDRERFTEYLSDVKVGKTKIAAGALFPHEIIQRLKKGGENCRLVAELQWKRMVDDLTEKGKLRDCIAVCDVSWSMYDTPIEVCVALGLLLSELSQDPWKGQVITFSENPKLHKIKGDDLRSKATFVEEMEEGSSTNFQKVVEELVHPIGQFTMTLSGRVLTQTMKKYGESLRKVGIQFQK